MTDRSAEDAPLSWLGLGDLAVCPPEVSAVFEATKSRIGFVRNAQRVMANAPAVMVAQDMLSRSLMQSGESSLSARERELIALVVSVENGCTACIFGHASRLRAVSGDAVWVANVEANYRHADLTGRERAMADYAIHLTRAPKDMLEDRLAPLRAAGLSDLDIIYVAAITAFYNFSNRINSGLGVTANSEAYLANR